MSDRKLSISLRRRLRFPGPFALPVLTLAWLFALSLGAPFAQAGPQAPDDGCLTEPTCRANYDQAVALFEGGRFEAALPKFQAAYAQRQMPWLLINIGRTLHRLGRPREALTYYERYKAAESKPDADTSDRLEKYIAQARALADSTPPGQMSPAQVSPDAPPAAPPSSEPPKPVSEEKPVYKKWWFWTAIGGGALAIVIIGAAAGAAAAKQGEHTTITPPTLPEGVQRVTFTF
jgi:tetratricopeptide (TPR) repeat protein